MKAVLQVAQVLQAIKVPLAILVIQEILEQMVTVVLVV